MKRLVELDVVRGVLLLMMVVNHSPSPLRMFTDQPLGFFSTAEGFVFVSAFLAGLLFQKRSDRSGFAAARRATLSRAIRIYRAHVAVLLFAFLVGALFLAWLPGLRNILAQFFENPWAAFPASLALAFQPPLMDILPMYIAFSLLTPVIFWIAQKTSWRVVLGGSLAVWLASQFHVRDLLLLSARDHSFINLGPFDLFSWQVLWVSGLLFGKSAQKGVAPFALGPFAETGLLAAALGLLAWRWFSISNNVDPAKTYWFLDKWHLGPIRLLNFFAVSWFMAKVLPLLRDWERFLRPLSIVGENMLPIFSVQICLSLLFVGALETGHHFAKTSTVLVVGQLCTVFLAAWFFHWRSNRQSASSPDLPTKSEPLLARPLLQSVTASAERQSLEPVSL